MSITHLWYWTLEFDATPLDTLIIPFKKVFVLMWRKVQFKVQFASNWSLNPCLKWPLIWNSLKQKSKPKCGSSSKNETFQLLKCEFEDPWKGVAT
jgi:hypothetical protein